MFKGLIYGICNTLKYSNHGYFTYSAGTLTAKTKVVTCTPRRQMGALSIAPIILKLAVERGLESDSRPNRFNPGEIALGSN